MNSNPLLSLLLLAAGLALGCDRTAPIRPRDPVSVLTARATLTNVPVLIQPPPVGHITPILSVTIRPQIGGTISHVNFQEGQDVQAGDLLFAIDPRPMQAALEQARANLQRDRAQMENARIQFHREQALFDQKLVSQDEYDTSRAAFDALAGSVAADGAAVTNAQLNLEFTQIRAPISGRTGALQFHEGNVVKAPDDVLLTINQIHPIYAVFSVPEQYLPVLQRQSRRGALAVAAAFDNMEEPAAPPRGKVTFLNNCVDAATGTIQLRATFPNDRDLLWPGQFVRLSLQLDELTNAVVVPSQAVQNSQTGQFGYVVQPDHTVVLRPVHAGIAYGGFTVIESGVSAGETVVTDGQLRLTAGAPVADKSTP